MARPTARTRSAISDAIIKLRATLGESQQQFANRLGSAVTTIARYETSRPPRGKALAQLADLARSTGQLELARVFSDALEGEYINADNQLDSGVVRALVENRGRQWLQIELQKLISEAKEGAVLRYPILNTPQLEPDQVGRVGYLENLLGLLRLQIEGTSQQRINGLAEERVRLTGEPFLRALSAVLREHPELYDLYQQERADAARGTSLAEARAVPGTRQHKASQKTKKGATK